MMGTLRFARLTESFPLAHAAWLKDVLVFLVAAGIVVPFFHRARIGAVLGFLLVGVAVGPLGLGQFAQEYPLVRFLTIDDRARVEPFAELGVIFLLFLIGLELSFERLWALRRYVLGVGSVQVSVSALLLGGACYVLGANGPASIILGLSLAFSSTAIVMQLLAEQHRAATTVGRICLSVLLFQDLMVVPILFIARVLGRGSGEAIALGLLNALIQAAAAVVLIAMAGRYVLRPLLRYAGKTGSRDLIMAITLLIMVGVAGATGASGLSTALGAFLAGLLLGETEYRHQIEVDLEPFKGLLLGLFFTTVGMGIDPKLIVSQFAWIAAAVLALTGIKASILFGANRAFGVKTSAAGEVALLLAQGGEFAFVVFGIARANGILSAEAVQFATIVVGLSMAVTPALALFAQRAGRRLERMDHGGSEPDPDVAELEDHVVIGGFGRVGQTVARMLDNENVPFVALDANGTLVSDQRKAGRSVYFGDASRPEMLQRAGAARARAFVVTLDAPGAAEQMIEAIRSQRPDAVIFARAKDMTHAERLAVLGAVHVIPEAVEASLQLSGRLLEELGMPAEVVAERLAQARDMEFRRLVGR